MLIVITCSPVDVWATVVMMATGTTAVMEATVALRGVVVGGSYWLLNDRWWLTR